MDFDWKTIVRTVAPMLGTAFGGPLAGAALNAIASAILPSDVEKNEANIAKALQNATPEMLAALKAADQAFAVKMKELDIDVLKISTADAAVQADLVKQDMTNPHFFVWGWRPAVGWICVLSMFYALIGYALLTFLIDAYAMSAGRSTPTLPQPDGTITFELLCALLGIGGLRTFEKLKGLTK